MLSLLFIVHRPGTGRIPVLHEECKRSAVTGHHHRSLRRKKTETAVPSVISSTIIKFESTIRFHMCDVLTFNNTSWSDQFRI